MKDKWWKESVVYQIYPRSFNDSNGDGIGDLKGIIEKVDYLDELGIDVIWLNPVYESPDVDNGYDISDYYSIHEQFGTMKDLDRLLEVLHSRGIKLIMDLVVNHTSDQHKWFVESCSAKDNKYRDYYIWRPGKEEELPNNWDSFFDSNPWEYDKKTGEYYLHLFSKYQPDLNWENPKVREEIYRMMTWWLDKGVDGFRMDVINLLSKTPGLPDGEIKDEGLTGREHFINGPKIHDYLQEMNEQVLSNYDIMTVGETPMVTPEEGLKYVTEDGSGLDMIFQFEHMDIDYGSEGRWSIKDWDLTELKKIMTKWQLKMQEGGGWNSLYLNNHDQPRMVSRFGNDEEYRVESAKMLATFLHTLQGTPYIYQGEEIGMTNVEFESLEELDDIDTLNNIKEEKEKGNIEDHETMMEIVRYRSRDNTRTPMQWNNEEYAGFTEGEPWLKVNPNYKEINVKQALTNPNSIFYYYQELINLRKEHPIIVYGDYELILKDDEEIYAYVRKLEDKKLLVILNFYEDQPIFELPKSINFTNKKLLISNYKINNKECIEEIKLKPYEARVYLLD